MIFLFNSKTKKKEFWINTFNITLIKVLCQRLVFYLLTASLFR